MLRKSVVLLRRGKPRPRAGMFPDRFRRVPAALKPLQGGQQYFNDFMVRTANEEILASQVEAGAEASKVRVQLPQAEFAETRDALDASIRREFEEMKANDSYDTPRAFNERSWYEEEEGKKVQTLNIAPAQPDGTLLPDRVVDNDYFRNRFGYSMVKETELQPLVEYSQLDLWGELPKYTRDSIFFYVISRRRNTYAVAFDFDGKRLLKPYTVGNRGLKGGDKGFRGDGSTDAGHQVTSMYLNDLIPKIREMRADLGKPLQKGEKIDVVLRVLGFYNGRQGGVRALADRSDMFNVRYVEDVTPFPMNGPKMPRGVFK